MILFVVATTVAESITLHPFFINGLVEAQGCFNIEIRKVTKNKNTVEIIILPSFFILQGNIAREIIMKISSLFNQNITCIRKPSTTSSLRYETKGVDELWHKICPHFKQYPLVSEKQNYFIFFERVLDILRKEKELTKKSLLEIIDIAYQMNLSSANDKSSKKEAKEHWLKIIEDHY